MTYSIVARDAATGQLGVAVQSHYLCVGPVVTWARAGVGAVATQSFVEPAYGPRGLALMADGSGAPEALAALVAADEGEAVRQVAMVDAAGLVQAHTGSRCIAAAGHALGEGFSCQANMMLKDTVWPAMTSAYDSAAGDLAARLMAALHAAEAEGGDIRGRQSAALLVVAAEDTGEPWLGGDVLVDLRVDDHADPLDELERLLALHRAFGHAEEAERCAEAGDAERAREEMAAAARCAPGNVELLFWQALSLAGQGREPEARALLEGIYRKEPRWAELLRRLPAAGLGPLDPDLVDRLAAPPR